MSKIRDWRGTEIEVGDRILYPVRWSSSMDMHEATVTEIGSKLKYSRQEPYIKADWIKASSNRSWRTVKVVTLTQLNRVTVIEKAKLPDATI